MAITFLAIASAQACPKDWWLQRWAKNHKSDLAAAARFLDSHPEVAARLDAKCEHAKRKHKKHRHPLVPIQSPTPHEPSPTPTPRTSPSPTATPVAPSPTPTATPTATATATPPASPTPTASPTCTPHDGCTLNRLEWINVVTWPVNTLELGSNAYTEEELRDILEYPGTAGDDLNPLARELIAAKLNIAAGAGHECVDDLVSEADELIGDLVPLPVGTDTITPTPELENLIFQLSQYNKGQSCCASHCPNQP
jgi:hypothetical protein